MPYDVQSPGVSMEQDALFVMPARALELVRENPRDVKPKLDEAVEITRRFMFLEEDAMREALHSVVNELTAKAVEMCIASRIPHGFYSLGATTMRGLFSRDDLDHGIGQMDLFLHGQCFLCGCTGMWRAMYEPCGNADCSSWAEPTQSQVFRDGSLGLGLQMLAVEWMGGAGTDTLRGLFVLAYFVHFLHIVREGRVFDVRSRTLIQMMGLFLRSAVSNEGETEGGSGTVVMKMWEPSAT